MNMVNQGKLLTGFPKLYSKLHFFECGDGWFQLIWDLSEKLSKFGMIARQVKEKFGGLRFYFDFDAPGYEGYDEARKLVEEAENLSYSVCEATGKPGKLRNDIGWLKTLCEEEYEKSLADDEDQNP